MEIAALSQAIRSTGFVFAPAAPLRPLDGSRPAWRDVVVVTYRAR